jgi:6-phosphogluconolactonase/glucosamine-6-phosphate isomerase/deaminase
VAVVGLTAALNTAAALQAGHAVAGAAAAAKLAFSGGITALSLYNYFCAKKKKE